MKKTIIGAIVGGILIFLWQFLSWPVLNLHEAANKYTPNQDAIMSVLQENLPEEGGYFIPGIPPNTPKADHERLMKEAEGKPWATIQYHKSMETNMVTNIIRGLFVNIVMVWLLCWILMKINTPGFGTIFTACLFTGLIVFFNSPYTGNIWFEWYDIMAHFNDAMVSWVVCGIWLGWWLRRK
jgi:hypothetical protein